MHSSPQQRYQQDLDDRKISADSAQANAISQLETLHQQLTRKNPLNLWSSLMARYQCLAQHKQTPIKGLYLWGGVGRGKTYLMDIFFDALPFENKTRLHFHRFMRHIHKELKTLKNEKNPLDLAAKHWSKNAKVICLDEFFVSDITDAMILAKLLEGLFNNGVTLVTTSNIPPDNLYKDGLQRSRFLAAIALLNRHTNVINVDGGTDYRLRHLKQAQMYLHPLNEATETHLKTSFANLAPDLHEVESNSSLEIEGRHIPFRYECEDVVWFDFDALCEGPRSQNDYIDIAKEYHAVLLSNVPHLTESKDNATRRFVNLVDEFYDRNVKLVISAETSLDELYSGFRLRFEFKRTQSRLREMQSHEYFSRAHKP